VATAPTALPGRRAATQSAPLRSERVPALDGLRGTILLVFLYHYFGMGMLPVPFLDIPLRLGWSGVDLFFVLSGFLLGGIVLDARESPTYYRTFYMRRAYRILPPYAIVLASLLIVRVVVPGLPMLSHQLPLWSYFTFTQNIAMVIANSHPGEFFGFQFGTPWLSGTWSLAIEEQFYLVLPFAVRSLNRARLQIWIIGAIFAAPLFRIASGLLLRDGALASYVLMPCRADALGFGVLVALLIRNQEAREWLSVRNRAFRIFTGLMAAGMTWFTLFANRHDSPWLVLVGYTWTAAFYACILVLVIMSPEGPVAKVMCIRPLRKLGQYSYVIYLIHGLVLYLLFNVIRHSAPVLANERDFGVAVLAATATLSIAALSWRYVEQPILARAKRWHY
jgi:peptidoglycan/LPS O-acetylase OafA/YrhL